MEYASLAKGNAALTTGIIGTAGVGLGLLGNLLGVNNGCANAWNTGCAPVCNENMPVNRYEAQQQAKISELETEVKLRDANTFTMGEMNGLRNYVDQQFREIRDTLCGQAVQNERVSGSFDLVRSDLCNTRKELYSAIQREKDERCCADNKIVNYVNATFYPKMVADITTGTTTTAQTLYNPLCSCCD